MTEPPLAPPPRKAHFRRGVRALRRGYSTFLAVVALILAGWFGLDIVRWAELTNDQRVLTFGFAACAVLAFAVWMFVDNPWRRDLRLARRGEVARGVITGMHKGRGRPPLIVITYSFCTATGEAITGECKLRRRARAEAIDVGAEIEILYDAKNPAINKPRLALDAVEFGEIGKKNGGA